MLCSAIDFFYTDGSLAGKRGLNASDRRPDLSAHWDSGAEEARQTSRCAGGSSGGVSGESSTRVLASRNQQDLHAAVRIVVDGPMFPIPWIVLLDS